MSFPQPPISTISSHVSLLSLLTQPVPNALVFVDQVRGWLTDQTGWTEWC